MHCVIACYPDIIASVINLSIHGGMKYTKERPCPQSLIDLKRVIFFNKTCA